MKEIYLIHKTCDMNGERLFTKVPATFCPTEEEARAAIERTIQQFKTWYPDLRVITNDVISTDVKFTDSDGNVNDVSYQVERVAERHYAW